MEKSLLSLEIRVNGRTLPEYYHQGQYWIEGRKGSAYQLVLRSKTPDRRILAVPSIDGLSVMDGSSASYTSSGYIIEPLQSITVSGWRLNDSEVARFQFHKAARSYASQTGQPKNVGVIGCAVFAERVQRPQMQWYFAGCDSHWGSQGMSMYRGLAACHTVTCGSCSTQNTELNVVASNSAPSLGTEFGERQQDSVVHTSFDKDSEQPQDVLEIRYADRQELKRRGIEIKKRPSVTDRPSAFPSQGCKPPAGWQG